MKKTSILFVSFFLIALLAKAQPPSYYESLEQEFRQDTARVEQSVRDMLDKDYSTAGMVKANVLLETEYDKLLNKYYKLLYKSLNDKGKTTLKITQRNWLKLRDSDQALVRTLVANQYKDTGGGSIWGIIGSGYRADIIRRRVFELFDYLVFGDLGGR